MCEKQFCNDAQCTRLGEALPLEDFMRDKKAKNGRMKKCRNCQRRIQNRRYAKKAKAFDWSPSPNAVIGGFAGFKVGSI